jgi:F0F1-type ATP synthase assembly protein I
LIFRGGRVKRTPAIDPDSKRFWRSAGTAGALGIEIALCFVIGGGLGYILDRKLNTHWIMYLGLFFGLGAAIKGVMRVVNQYKREVEADDKSSGGSGGGGASAN